MYSRSTICTSTTSLTAALPDPLILMTHDLHNPLNHEAPYWVFSITQTSRSWDHRGVSQRFHQRVLVVVPVAADPSHPAEPPSSARPGAGWANMAGNISKSHVILQVHKDMKELDRTIHKSKSDHYLHPQLYFIMRCFNIPLNST